MVAAGVWVAIKYPANRQTMEIKERAFSSRVPRPKAFISASFNMAWAILARKLVVGEAWLEGINKWRFVDLGGILPHSSW